MFSLLLSRSPAFLDVFFFRANYRSFLPLRADMWHNEGMKIATSSTVARVLRISSKGQRRAAIFAAVSFCVLLVGTIAGVIAYQAGYLRPTPTNDAQLQYTVAVEAERAAVAAAQAAGADLDTDPDVVVARVNLARAYLALGQVPQAARLSQRLFDANMEDANVVLLHANVLERQGRMARALPAYQRVLDLVGSGETEIHREAWRGIGTAMLDQGDREGALDAFRRAAAIRPESPALYVSAGDVALDLKLWEQAAENFLRARLFGMNNESLNQKIADLERNHSEAVESARETIEASFNRRPSGDQESE